MTYGFDEDKSKKDIYKKDEVYSKEEVYPKTKIISVSNSITVPADSEKEAHILLPAGTDLNKVLVLSVEQRRTKKAEGESQTMWAWLGAGGGAEIYRDEFITLVNSFPLYWIHPSVQGVPAIIIVVRNTSGSSASIAYRCKYMILD